MKRLLVLATLAASVTGCVADQGDAPVRLLGVRSLSGTAAQCTLGDTQQAQGSLDISGGGTYVMGVNVETINAAQPVVVNGETFSGPGLGDVNLRELVLTYESEPSLSLPAEERIPYYAVFRPQTAGADSFALLYAIGPEALAELQRSVPVGTTVTLLSTVKAVGKFSGGATVETNEITYPIIVRNSGYNRATNTCPVAGQQPVGLLGPCDQPGQDTGLICRVPTPTP